MLDLKLVVASEVILIFLVVHCHSLSSTESFALEELFKVVPALSSVPRSNDLKNAAVLVFQKLFCLFYVANLSIFFINIVKVLNIQNTFTRKIELRSINNRILSGIFLIFQSLHACKRPSVVVHSDSSVTFKNNILTEVSL